MRTLLSCLGLGLVGAACSGMSGAVAPFVGGVIGNVIGTHASDFYKILDRKLAARFLDGWSGIDENHHVVKGLRHAQIAALRQILTRFNEARKTDPDEPRKVEQDDFAKAFATFLKSDKPSHFDEQILREDVLRHLPEAFDTSLAARRASKNEPEAKAAILASQAQIKAVVEQAVLAEIRLRVMPATIPALFENAFLGKGFADGWFDCFTRAAADGLKDGTEFATIWQAEQQAILKAIVDAHTAMLAEIKADTGEIKADTGEIKEDTKAIRQELREANAKIDLILAKFDQGEKAQEAKDSGLESQTIIALAQRLKPSETLDINQARIELENAVTIAIEVIARGERSSNDEAFINDVLKRVAALTLAGQLDKGAQEIDAALAEIDRQEAEQKDTIKRRRITMLEAGIQQDTLRRDAKAVARRIEALVGLEDFDERQRFKAVYNYWDGYYTEGDEKGNNLSLEIAIELGRVLVRLAYDTYTRGASLGNLGNALLRLGERESGTTRLEEAIDGYRKVLKEFNSKDGLLYWAKTQNNLGAALRILGERKGDILLLNDAVTALRLALEVRTRERVPLQWATTQINLGNALSELGRLKDDIVLLNDAVTAYREGLRERTRERVPLDWATTQNNLGSAYLNLSIHENNTKWLNDAVTAYNLALNEYKREISPLDYAMTQYNLGNALQILGERKGDTALLNNAVTAYRCALEEFKEERSPYYHNVAQQNLARCLALIKSRS